MIQNVVDVCKTMEVPTVLQPSAVCSGSKQAESPLSHL